MKDIKMAGEMRNRAVELLNIKAMADARLQSFLEGCKAGLKLDGDYNIDLQTLTFAKIKKEVK